MTQPDPTTPKQQKLLDICDYIKSLDTTPKDFVRRMLTSPNAAIAKRRNRWANEAGWASTLQILKGFKTLMCSEKEGGKERWAQFILEEAKEIVNQQDSPSGNPPDGMYYHPENITSSFLEAESQEFRNQVVLENMPFLSELISSKLEHAQKARGKKRSKKKESEDSEESDSEKDSSASKIEASRLAQLPAIMCSMLAYACNRRHCGFQLETAINLLRIGINEKVHNYLHSIGLITSHATGRKAKNKLFPSKPKNK